MRFSTLFLFLFLLVSFHLQAQKIIFCDFNGNQIRRTVVGSTINEPLTFTGNMPRNIIIDQLNNKLYWIENNQDVIAMNLDGTGKEVLNLNSLGVELGDICIGEKGDVLYYTEYYTGAVKGYDLESQETSTVATGISQSGAIVYSSIDSSLFIGSSLAEAIYHFDLGTETQEVLPGIYTLINDLRIDAINAKLYITEFNTRSVYRSNLDGSEPETLQESLGINGRLFVDAENGNYYWGDNLAPGFVPTIYQSDITNNATSTAFEYGTNSIGGFVVLGEITTSNVEREALSPTYFPNPASEQLNIDLGNMIDVESIEIYAANGQLLLQQSVNGVSKRLLVSLDKLQSGLHILKVTGSELVEPVTFQVIK